MNENFKNAIIKSLSEILPPFAESISSLLKYIEDDIDYDKELLLKLADILNHSQKVSNELLTKLVSMQGTFEQTQEAELSTHSVEWDLIEVEMNTIQSMVREALLKIQEGVSNLIYLAAKERNLLEKMRETGLHDKLFDRVEEPNTNQAVDNLYQGSKILIEIIDKVID